MTETVVDASSVSPEVLIWLKRANDGHYFIERCPNRSDAICNFFKVPESLAIKWIRLPTEDAWIAMEKYVDAAPV